MTGRYAGKKAVIVRSYDEGTSGRKYGHAVVCGLSKEPRKVDYFLCSLLNKCKPTSAQTTWWLVGYQEVVTKGAKEEV